MAWSRPEPAQPFHRTTCLIVRPGSGGFRHAGYRPVRDRAAIHRIGRRRRRPLFRRQTGVRRAGDQPRRDRWPRRRCRLAPGAGDHPVPRVPAEGRRRPALCHRGESRLRRPQRLRLHPRLRPASRQHPEAAGAPRRARRHRSAQDHDRFVSRPAQRLRVCREPSRGEARLRDLQRQPGRRRVGRRVGCRHAGRLARVDGRVSDPAFAAALRPARHQHVRVRDLA